MSATQDLLTLSDAEREEYWSGRGPIFKEGQKVVCLDADGSYDLKRGEIYEVSSYTPRRLDDALANFVWPAYASVKIGGKDRSFHATRFRAIPAGTPIP